MGDGDIFKILPLLISLMRNVVCLCMDDLIRSMGNIWERTDVRSSVKRKKGKELGEYDRRPSNRERGKIYNK